jgi:hypothetical protein
MSKTLTIAGNSFLSQYRTDSARIRELVQNKSGVMNLEITALPGQDAPQEGSEIVFKDGSRFLFGGYITRVQSRETGLGQHFAYGVEASDYSWIFNNKIARRSYENKTLKFIAEDLLDAYLDSSYGFTTANIATGPTIDSVTFDHVPLRKCFEKLAKLTGYVWYVDYEKRVYFTAPTATAAPEAITDSSGNFSDVSIAYDISQVRNTVIVIGSEDGEQDAQATTQAFAGDGETRAWELELKPSQIVSIKVNGVSKQFSLDVNERDTDAFVYSFSGQSIRLTDSQATPAGGGTPDQIEIVYYGRIPVITKVIDNDSVAFFAALDGGDGAYEYTIKDPSIASKDEAWARGMRELDEFADPLVNGTFKTRTSLLSGGSIFSPGQMLTVNLPTHGIAQDAAFLVQEVNISLSEDAGAGTTEYTYEVRFGGKLAGVQEFLESLASQEDEAPDTLTGTVFTIEGLSDSLALADGSLSHAIFTPPFKFGPSGSPVFKFGFSEFG